MLIAQITDPHVGCRVEGEGGVVDGFESLQRAVAHLAALDPRPDVVLITGDMTVDSTPEEYAGLKEALAGLPIPYFLIPGNHDDRERLRATFPEAAMLRQDPDFIHYTVEDYPLRLIGLDTLVPGKVGGELCEARLSWLEARLCEAPDRPTVIFMHHPPLAVGIPGFDGIACENGEGLGRILDRHVQVEAVLCGHVHRPISLCWHGTAVHITPSTVYQYPLDLSGKEGFSPVAEPAACRLCLWHEESGLVSHLSYIP